MLEVSFSVLKLQRRAGTLLDAQEDLRPPPLPAPVGLLSSVSVKRSLSQPQITFPAFQPITTFLCGAPVSAAAPPPSLYTHTHTHSFGTMSLY